MAGWEARLVRSHHWVGRVRGRWKVKKHTHPVLSWWPSLCFDFLFLFNARRWNGPASRFASTQFHAARGSEQLSPRFRRGLHKSRFRAICISFNRLMWRRVHRVGVVMLMDHLQVLQIIPTVDHRAHTISHWLYPWWRGLTIIVQKLNESSQISWLALRLQPVAKHFPWWEHKRADAQNGMPLHVFWKWGRGKEAKNGLYWGVAWLNTKAC